MNKGFLVRFVAALIIASSIGVVAYATFRSSDNVDKNIVFSDRTLLEGLWDNYKKVYWEDSTGRTLDKQQNDITTSEGQSYTMLRAVWQSDRTTFDTSWDWTKEHLDRPQDALFAWKWGKKADGSYGVMTEQGGQNTASDADSDIALALLMAASRWQHQPYLDDAKAIIRDMWKQEVVSVNDVPYFVANNLEKDSQKPMIVNPSYLSPYAYRLFARVDTSHDWQAVVDSSYDVLNRSIDDKLDKALSARIVPDWVTIDKKTGALAAVTDAPNLTTNYGFDAMRAAFRLAVDDAWNNEPRAKSTLAKMSFLKDRWQSDNVLYSTYSHDGSVVKRDEVAEMYATTMGYFMVTNPSLATEIYDKKLKPLYDQNKNAWSHDMTYYGDNWSWFGIALYDGKLDNLAADIR